MKRPGMACLEEMNQLPKTYGSTGILSCPASWLQLFFCGTYRVTVPLEVEYTDKRKRPPFLCRMARAIFNYRPVSDIVAQDVVRNFDVRNENDSSIHNEICIEDSIFPALSAEGFVVPAGRCDNYLPVCAKRMCLQGRRGRGRNCPVSDRQFIKGIYYRVDFIEIYFYTDSGRGRPV